jgi:hypothetical protein
MGKQKMVRTLAQFVCVLAPLAIAEMIGSCKSKDDGSVD